MLVKLPCLATSYTIYFELTDDGSEKCKEDFEKAPLAFLRK